jgi:hypothetical protein
MDLGQWIVIGLSVGMVAWFFGASSYNRQREEKAFRWIYRGLKRHGEPEPLGRAGSRARLPGLEVSTASGPFRKIVVLYRLERRENPPLWIFQHMQGKRDELEVKLVLKQAAKGKNQAEELEKVKSSLGSYRSALLEDGLKSDGRELLIRFNLKGLLGKDAEEFFETLKRKAAG